MYPYLKNSIDCMKYLYTAVLFAAINTISLNALSISSKPVATYYTQNSIINRLSKDYLQYVGTRARFSTCTGVAWFSDSFHLISANLLDNSLQTYRFKPKQKKLVPRKKFDNSVTLIGWPENLSISKNGTLLAVSNSYTGKVTIYRLDPKTSALSPSPIAQIYAGDHGLHGVRFSPDGRFLSYVTYDGLGKVRIFRISSTVSGNPAFDLCCTINCTFEGLSPKGLDFSHDMKYMAICFSGKASSKSSDATGKLAIFNFDREKGIIHSSHICEVGTNEYLNTPEDVLFSSDDSCLLVSNQGNDTITAHQFDPETCSIRNSHIALKSPEAQLNFPHGISLSPDGKYLAVSNYGDDKICLYSISPN